MQINMTGRRFDITSSLREYTKEKFSRLEHHFDAIHGIEVIFEVEKLRQLAEATVSVPGEKIYASAESEDMYMSVLELVDKLDRKIKKHKEKAQSHREK